MVVQNTQPLSRAELAERYPDVEWREKLLDLMALVGILRECIIESSYRPSEGLQNAILLSEAGKQVRTRLITQEKVAPRDAPVLTLLGLVYIDPLLDVEAIRIDNLAAAISDEIISRALKFPMIFGRDLYQRCATSFREERAYLNHEDTLKLLDGMDQGVFQSGHFLLGPYGILRRPYDRYMGPITSIPLQHCSDSACPIVHRVQLTTSIEAGVNRSRPALGKILDQVNDEPSEWNGFVSDITEDRLNEYATSDALGVAYLLGDALSDDELRRLLNHASEHTGGAMQAALKELGLTGPAKDVFESQGRAQMLQTLLMFDDESLAALTDSAIHGGVIQIPGDEIRRPKVNRAWRFGAWSSSPQLSRLGVRSLSSDPDLPLLRLQALVRDLFDTNSASEMDELSWMLRETRGETADDQLAEFLRASDPAMVIETLVLSRRTNAQRASTTLGIDFFKEDPSLRDTILWKLGFPLPRSTDIRDEYWRLHSSLEGLARTASVGLTSTAEGLRQAASDYFVSLERFLFDSLVFATWGLLQDHYTSRSPFTFFESEARQFTIATLNAGDGDDQFELTNEPVLSAVVEGFSRLAKRLRTLQTDADRRLRRNTEIPKFASKTDLQSFPFLHTFPFLDLLPHSQLRLIETLAQVAAELNDSGIMTARNGLLHAKQRVPLISEVEESLRKARLALDRLESIGCVRSTFAHASSVLNAWGGSTTTLVSNGRSISFFAPSRYEWAKLPSLGRPIYLMQGAVFARPNEMLRFAEGFDSAYQTYWANFPVRPEKGNRLVSTQSESLSTASETGTYSAARAG